MQYSVCCSDQLSDSMKILNADHWLHCAAHIRSLIDVLDAHVATADKEQVSQTDDDITDDEKLPLETRSIATYAVGNIYLGAVAKGVSLESIQQKVTTDPQYKNFLPHLRTFIQQELPPGIDMSQHINSETVVCEWK